MTRNRVRLCATLLALAALAGPGAALSVGAAQGSSLRYTVRCNVDGSYDCANAACNGQFCCQYYGGINAE